jgi:predicted TIM-barrel fold metal-dependent hydrolase
MKIDAHTHIGKLPNSPYSESYEKNLALILDEAKQNGVDALIMIAGLEKEDGRNLTTKSLINLISSHKNIYAVAGIDINYEKEYLVQLEKWLKEKQIIGIKFYTGYQHFYPNDERCTPLYELCLRYNVPVIFHSGDTLAGYVPNPKIKYSHPIHIDDTATDFPYLKIIIAHMGNPWLIDCAEVLYKNPNVYADISGLVTEDDLHTAYGDIMRKRIRELLEYISPQQKLLYGTDWPLCHMKQYIEFADTLGLKKEDMEKLFSGNAKAIFKI